jgi:hypothetical protein
MVINKEKEFLFKKHNASTPSTGMPPGELSISTIDPREIDQILREIASICQKSHLFDRFLRVRASDKVEILASEFNKNPNGIPPPKENKTLTKTSKLNELIQGIFIFIKGMTANFVLMVFYCFKKRVIILSRKVLRRL